MATFRIPQTPCVGDQSCQPMYDASGSWLRPPLGMLWAASPFDLDSAFAMQVRVAAEPDITFLFNSCRNPNQGLTDEDFAAAAITLGVEVAAIKAVAEVETSGNPFDDAGRPRILYERHYFHSSPRASTAKSIPTSRTPWEAATESFPLNMASWSAHTS